MKKRIAIGALLVAVPLVAIEADAAIAKRDLMAAGVQARVNALLGD